MKNVSNYKLARNMTKTVTPVMTPFKTRLFFAITIFTPVVILVFLEIALRVFDYGTDLSLFNKYIVWGKTYYQMNPGIKDRYFGTSEFQPSTDPVFFQVPKPEGTYRIFAIGESTTAGYPYWFNGAFPDYLETRLRKIFPDKKIEMINLGMTATNSFTALDILKDLPAYQPDLIVYYGGHNEFYGALGVASNLSAGRYRLLTEAYLTLIHLRTFQLVRNVIHGIAQLFGSKEEPLARGTEMERVARGRLVPFGSPLYDAAYSIFRDNLEGMKNYCREHGLPLIIGTQVSDLRDQKPFVSGHSPGISQESKMRFDGLFKKGISLQSAGSWDSAAAVFRSAILLDSLYADAHYRLAQCLDTLGEKEAALNQYIMARDYDELRFRTDSKFNDLIRSMSDNKYCFVADVSEAFKSLSPDSLIGHNLIFEHLHPNSKGAFEIAKCYSDVMRTNSMIASTISWDREDTVSDARIWEDRHVTDIDERMARFSVDWLISGWPFKDELPSIRPVPAADTLDWIAEEAVAGKISWVDAHMYAIRYYERRSDWDDVSRVYRTLLDEAPLDLGLHDDLAQSYIKENRTADAAAVLVNSIHIYPTLQAYRTLGDIMMRMSRPDSAADYYERTEDFAETPAERVQNETALCYAYARGGEYAKAKGKLLEMLAENPGNQAARRLLQDIEAITTGRPTK